MFPDPPKDWLIEEKKEEKQEDGTAKPRKSTTYTYKIPTGSALTLNSLQKRLIADMENALATDPWNPVYGSGIVNKMGYYELDTKPQTFNILKEPTKKSMNPFQKIGKICQHGIPKTMCRKKGCK